MNCNCRPNRHRYRFPLTGHKGLRGAQGLCSIGVLCAAAGVLTSQPVDLEYYRSDLNYDGYVDQDDYDILYANLPQNLPQIGPCDDYQLYHHGDIDRDGDVDTDDQNILWADWAALNYQQLTPIPNMPGVLIGSGYDPVEDRINAVDWHTLPTDAALSAVLIDGNSSGLLNQHRVWQDPGPDDNNIVNIAPSSVELEGYYEGGRTDGFDIILTWVNHTNDPVNYGRIRIPGIRFGPDIYLREFRRSSEEILVQSDLTDQNPYETENLGNYPRGMYAPCLTMRGFVHTGSGQDPSWPDMAQYPAPIGQVEEATPDRCLSGPGGNGSPGGSFQTTEPEGFREYVLGASVIMPMLEYKARTSFTVQSYWDETDYSRRYWNIQIEPNPKTCPRTQAGEYGTDCVVDPQNGIDERVFPEEGLIQPGEERTIRIQIRFYRTYSWYKDELAETPAHPGDYLRLFREYRRYFKQTYGDVRYTRDVRPIRRIPVFGVGCFDTSTSKCPSSPPSATSCQSRFGITASNDWSRLVDPDPSATDPLDTGPDGWEYYTTVDSQNPSQGVIERFRQEGFQRVMLSNPSGWYCPDGTSDPLYNMPFAIDDRWRLIAEITDQPNWQNHPILTTLAALGDWQSDANVNEISRYGDRELSLWWGRSSLPSQALRFGDTIITWDQTLLDRCPGSASRLKAEEQLLGMAETGASMIGLDFMSQLPEWDTYFWLQDMLKLSDAAGTNITKFGTETYHSDFNHTIAPTYFQLYKSTTVDPPNGPHGMRDFLNQDAESWGVISGGHNDILHDEAAMQCAMRLVAQWGFTPKIIMNNSIDIFKPYEPSDPYFPMIDEAYVAADSWLDTVPPDLIEP